MSRDRRRLARDRAPRAAGVGFRQITSRYGADRALHARDCASPALQHLVSSTHTPPTRAWDRPRLSRDRRRLARNRAPRAAGVGFRQITSRSGADRALHARDCASPARQTLGENRPLAPLIHLFSAHSPRGACTPLKPSGCAPCYQARCCRLKGTPNRPVRRLPRPPRRGRGAPGKAPSLLIKCLLMQI